MTICKTCGGSEFYASGKCAACVRQRVKKWQELNPDRAKATKQRYYLANREAISEQSRLKRADNIETVRESERLRSAINRKENPEKIKNNQTKYREANREKLRAYERKRRELQPDKVRASKKKWRDNNPEQCRLHCQNRHARKKYNGGKLSSNIIRKLMELQKGQCACCRVHIRDNYHIDHIMPLAKGGANTDKNVQLLCQPCNQSKNAKDPIDFMQSRGFLC